MRLKTEALASMCEAVIDCPHSTPVWTDSGFVVLRNQDIKSGRLDLSAPSFTDEDHFKHRVRRMAPRHGDIVITREAPMGEVCKIPEGLQCCLGQRQVLLRPKADVDPDYLLYALQSPFVQNQIRWNEGTGSTVSNIRIPVLEKIEIPRHGDAETSIAKMLSSVDAKIDLNRRINQTLEAMAQAIFKSWFVDFDPVKAKIAAKQEGRDPLRAAMSAISGKPDAELDALPREQYDSLAATVALFPDEMEESELGEIPRGWGVKSLPEIIDFLEGPGIRNWQYTEAEDGIKFINIRCIKDGDLKLDTASKITSEEAFGKYSHFQLAEDDIVISISGTLGRFGFVRKSHLPLSLNTSVVRFRPMSGKSTMHFIAGFVETQLQRELETRASGSAQRNFGPMHLKQIEILLPPYQILEAHGNMADSLFQKRKGNLNQTDALISLRDTLLPKLLSGELSVTEAMAEA